jgi:glycosyltransferase involved in cell wall biosynthesis
VGTTIGINLLVQQVVLLSETPLDAENLVKYILRYDNDNNFIVVTDHDVPGLMNYISDRCKIFFLPAKVRKSEHNRQIPGLGTILEDVKKKLNKYHQKLMLTQKSIGKTYRRFISGTVLARWEQGHILSLDRIIEENSIDYWFCPLGWMTPSYISIPSVLLVNDEYEDAVFHILPREEAAMIKRYIPSSYERADRIITPNAYLRDLLISQYNINNSKIQTIPFRSVDVMPHHDSADIDHLRSEQGITSFCFYPADFQLCSNHFLLLIGFHLFKKKTKDPMKLVLSLSNYHTDLSMLNEFIQRLGLKGEVILLSAVSEDFQFQLLKSSDFVIYPSLSRGFSFSLAGAMSVGAPIAVSDTSSMREVLGDSAIYFDPKKPDSICQCITRFFEDYHLRQSLSRSVIERSRTIGINQSVKQLMDIFADCNPIVDGDIKSVISSSIFQKIEGVYADHWLSTHASISFSNRYKLKKIVLDFHVQDVPELLPLRLIFILNNKVIGQYKVCYPGDHSSEITLKKSKLSRIPIVNELIISSSKAFVPKQLGFSDDNRSLVAQVIGIKGVTEKAEALVFYTAAVKSQTR